MINAIKNYFNKSISTDVEKNSEQNLKLATAALLVEMMHQDDQVLSSEIASVKDSLKQSFHLNEDEANELFKLAEQEAKASTDYHQFTTLIAKNYSQEQKIKVIEYLWSIAYADNVLDSHEEHMVRHIAGLIFVSHKDYIKAKHRVQEKMK